MGRSTLTQFTGMFLRESSRSTAANVEPGDKGWLIDDLVNLKKLGLKWIDIVDISAIHRRQWSARMDQADVLYFGGGKRYHLMDWIPRSGLTEVLPELLERRVYVGMSAGSMVTGRTLGLRLSHVLYQDDLERTRELKGLGYVDFSVLPHLNNSSFPRLTEGSIEKATRDMTDTVYALDDASALRVVDREVSTVIVK